MKVIDLYHIIDEIAPFSIAMQGDNPGLLLGHNEAEVGNVLVSLEPDMPALREAAALGCNVLVSHHPFMFSGENHVNDASALARRILFAAEKGIAVISAHTNLDAAPDGINDTLGALLGFTVTDTFVPTQNGGMLGRIGSHRFDSAEHFLYHAAGALQVTPRYRLVNDRFERVAWVSGSGASEMEAAKAAGADTLVTGDCKYSAFIKAEELGINLIDLGHFETEQIIVPKLAEKLRAKGLTVFTREIECPFKTLE